MKVKVKLSTLNIHNDSLTEFPIITSYMKNIIIIIKLKIDYHK